MSRWADQAVKDEVEYKRRKEKLEGRRETKRGMAQALGVSEDTLELIRNPEDSGGEYHEGPEAIGSLGDVLGGLKL